MADAPANPTGVKYCAMYTLPIRLMDEAKARGCNLLVHSESENGTVLQRAWRSAARDRGLPYVDTYLDDSDTEDPSLLGWIVRDSDEWNRKRTRKNPTTGAFEDYLPEVTPFVAEAQKLAALNAARGTSKWIMANADGPSVTTALDQKPPYNGVRNNEKALLPFLTVRSVDWYPVNNTAQNTPAEIARRPLDLPAKAVYRLRTWSDEIGAPPALYAAFVEAQKGWNSPLAVTPDQMREQVAYLTGDKAFPFPSPTGKSTLSVKQPLIDILIWWTANGQSGPGWKWIAQTPEQAAAQTDITRGLLGTTLPPLPDDPAPDPRDALVAELQRQVADAEKRAETAADQYAVCAARVVELQDAIRGLLSASDAVDVAKAKLVTAAK
jgi:hypothetical protein